MIQVASLLASVPLLAWGLILLMIGVFALGLYWKSRGKKWTFVQHTPVLLTSLGLLGTFWGITWSLLWFDVGNLQDSIPGLLDGMKTAFVTSVVGLSLALVFRVFIRDPSLEGEDIRVKDPRQALSEVAEGVKTIRSCLAADTETSIASQLKMMRVEVKDSFKELASSIDTFAAKVADNSVKAIIQALEEVIRDFNAKINEQLGDNFKQLNEAVGRLNQWQQANMEQMDKLTKLTEAQVEGIETIERSFTEIAEKARVIVDASQLLRELGAQLLELAERFTAQQDALEEVLQAFEELKNNAVSALPTVKQHLEDMTKGLKAEVDKVVVGLRDTVADTIEYSQKLVDEQIHATSELRRNLEKLVQSQKEASEKARTQLESVWQGVDTHSRELVQSVSNRLAKRLDEATIRQSKLLEEMLSEFDRNLRDELRKSLELLGQALATLSGKFVDDYQEFSEALGKIESGLTNLGKRFEA